MKKQSRQNLPAQNLQQRPFFSETIRKVAQRELRELELQSDRDFLTRAEIDRRLNSL